MIEPIFIRLVFLICLYPEVQSASEGKCDSQACQNNFWVCWQDGELLSHGGGLLSRIILVCMCGGKKSFLVKYCRITEREVCLVKDANIYLSR